MTLGIPLGISSLVNVPAVIIERASSIIVIVFCLLFTKKMSTKIRRESLIGTVVGFVSGAIAGFSAMGGPLVLSGESTRNGPSNNCEPTS